MIAGALEFTLGLQANKFLEELGLAGGKLLSFAGIAEGIKTAFDKMWEAVQEGGKLRNLAVGAGTSVANLYSLQEAFQDIGASADGAAPLIKKMQRTLADSDGRDALRSIGLDPDKLKGKESADQIELVAAALAKLNRNRQTQAAFSIFGREGSNSVLQIARSGKEFEEAMRETREDAKIWQLVAEKFHTLNNAVNNISQHLRAGFALAAGALIAAFEKGTMGELIKDTVVTAFEAAVAVLPGVLGKIGEILLRIFKLPLAYLQAGIEYAIQDANPLRALANGDAGKALQDKDSV
jgi:hypothetical protein